MTQLYDRALRPVGLRVTQFSILGKLREQGPIPLTELAEELVIDRTTLTRNLELLRRQGLTTSRPGADGRVREISLTRRGNALLEQAYPYWEEAQRRVEEALGENRVRRLFADLDRAVKAT